MKTSIMRSMCGVFAGILFFSAGAVHAGALTSAQVQAVLQLLQSFNADPAVIQNVALSLGGQTGYMGGGVSFCPALSYNLYFGLTDAQTTGQVSQLQQYLGVPQSGYFGAQTRQAVAQFQGQQNVYPITGGVGPLTRATIAHLCGQTYPTYPPYQTGTLSITSVSGPTSLSVGQQGTWGIITNAPAGSYVSVSVRWGDENLYGYAMSPQASSISQQNTFSHAYQSAGTYTVVFTATDPAGRSNSASATVVVGGSGCGYYPCSSGISISQPSAGQVLTRGQDMPIIWSVGQSIPSNASVMLDLYAEGGSKVGTIAIPSLSAGSYTWHIPAFPQNYMCTMIYPNGLCGANIPTGTYYIEATVTTNGFDTNAIQYGSAQSGLFTISTGGSTSQNATVNGTVTSGPTCPVERYPADPNCADRTFQTSLNIYSNGAFVTNTQTSTGGYFSVNLNPGTYEFRANENSGSLFPRCAPQTVTAQANMSTTLNISCDTGIR